MTAESLGVGLAYYVVFLFSITLHEAGHAWAAMLGGDLTAYHGGQVTLDPRPHIKREPFGMVVLPLLSSLFLQWPFGYASAPYDPHWALNHTRRAGWMALAGPAANLAIAIAAGILIRIGILAGVFSPPESISFSHVVASTDAMHGAAFMLSTFFSLNVLLCFFNLIPAPPLDGSTAVLVALSPSAGRAWLRVLWTNPMLSWIGILVAWKVFPLVYDPAWLFMLRLLYPEMRYG